MSMDDLEGRKQLLKLSRLRRGRILDVGLGECGCMSFYLAKRGFDVTGIDSSPLAVHKSREEAAGKKLKGSFQARRINAVKTPFKKASFDAVFSYHSLHHMKNMPKAMHEMFRVCKNGGSVVISDLHAGGRKEYEHAPDERFLPAVERQLKKYAKSIKKGKTDINEMYICRKK
ncbi:MAG: class I SAM-dependent methyltransferase [Candidatus Aminicenantes bacterium]|nr:class I SAM-dependent methyltransferase [Candidatus Aminicenantes bacterium]